MNRNRMGPNAWGGRTYYGVIVHPMGPNSWGGRWWAMPVDRVVRADTLAGIKALIREDLGR